MWICPGMWWNTFYQIIAPKLSYFLLPLQKMLKWIWISCGGGQIVVKKSKLFLKKVELFPPLSMVHTLLKRMANFHFTMLFLLWSTWFSVLKVNAHPILLARPFKMFIFLRIDIPHTLHNNIITFKSLSPTFLFSSLIFLSRDYFKQKVFSSKISNQCFLLLKVGQRWTDVQEQPLFKILECLAAFLLSLLILALLKAKSSQSLNTPVRLSLIALPVAWVISSEG